MASNWYKTEVVRTAFEDLGTAHPRMGQLEALHAQGITETLNKANGWELDHLTTLHRGGELITFLILVGLRHDRRLRSSP